MPLSYYKTLLGSSYFWVASSFVFGIIHANIFLKIIIKEEKVWSRLRQWLITTSKRALQY
jgi:hypothetical protein